MPTELTYGHKKPIDGESGSIFCPALENNIDLDDAHSHDGVTSEKIVGSNITKSTAQATSGSWAADGNGWIQTVSLPSGYSYDTTNIVAKVSDDIIYPTIRKVSDTSFSVKVNDNSITVNFLIS